MKRMNQDRYIILLLIVSCFSVLYLQKPSRAQSSDPGSFLCYLETESGQIINLDKICGKTTSNSVVFLSATDQEFIKTYRNFLSKRSRALPSVQIALSQLQNFPERIVQRALKVCVEGRSGILQNQAILPQEAADTDLINTMALEYYCPELDD